MCIAIFKPQKAEVTEQQLWNSYNANRDGAGFAYVSKGKVVVEKGFTEWEPFLSAYNKAIEAHKNSPFLIHFRIRTHGIKGPTNTHPFELACGAALIHNGAISGTGANYMDGPSDTSVFANKYGDKLTEEWVTSNKIELEKAIGSSNKIVLLYPNKHRVILNEDAGHWENDVWFSTRAYKFDKGTPPACAC